MSTEKLVEEMKYGNRAISNHIQSLGNIGILAILYKVLKDAEKEEDEGLERYCKFAMIGVMLLQVLISISNLVNACKKK